MKNEGKTFKANTSYLMNWIGDSSLKTEYKVLRRTEKSVWLKNVGTGEECRCKINIYENEEYCFPTGKYSMAPTLKAGKIKA